jgi:hypothetical protein
VTEIACRCDDVDDEDVVDGWPTAIPCPVHDHPKRDGDAFTAKEYTSDPGLLARYAGKHGRAIALNDKGEVLAMMTVPLARRSHP